jgi:hypothetical protein
MLVRNEPGTRISNHGLLADHVRESHTRVGRAAQIPPESAAVVEAHRRRHEESVAKRDLLFDDQTQDT